MEENRKYEICMKFGNKRKEIYVNTSKKKKKKKDLFITDVLIFAPS